MTAKVEAFNARMAELKSNMIEEGKKLFNECIKELFEKYPDLKSFAWDQYTPYFNDGDACYFSVNEVHSINEVDEYSDEGYEAFKKLDEKMRKDVQKTVSSFPDDVMEELFGDHVTVTISRGDDGNIGSSTDEKEHD